MATKITAAELDRIRSKPIIQLTPAEIDCLTEREQRGVYSMLARWEAQDAAGKSAA